MQLRWIILSLLCLSAWADDPGPNRHDIDFSGHWELDYQRSDHPAEKTRHLYIQARSHAERQMERANNLGQRLDTGYLNVQSIVGLGRLTEKIAQATVLEITQDKEQIMITRNDDFALTCDFSRTGFQTGAIGSESCAWDEDQLIFRILLPDGLQIEHKLSIASDRSRINIETVVAIKGLPYPYILNRVYMPFEPGEGLYRCEFTVARQTTCSLKGTDTVDESAPQS